jgi:hypothetical protein
VDGEGAVFVTGSVSGSVDFGGGTLTSAGLDDVVLATFDAKGNYRWAKLFGDALNQEAWGIAVDPTSSRVIIVGGFSSTIDFGCGPLVSAGGNDAFVAAFVR